MDCIKELDIEYYDLKKDLKLFYKLNRLDDVVAIKVKKRDVFTKMETIYVELRSVLIHSNSKFNENQINYYNAIIDLFQDYYAAKMDTINKELHHKKLALNTF